MYTYNLTLWNRYKFPMSKRKQATTTVSTLPYLSDLKRQKTESKSEGQHTGCIIAKIASTILKEVEHRAFTTGVVDFVAQYAIPVSSLNILLCVCVYELYELYIYSPPFIHAQIRANLRASVRGCSVDILGK